MHACQFNYTLTLMGRSCPDKAEPRYYRATQVTVTAVANTLATALCVLPRPLRCNSDADGHGTHTASTAAGNYGVHSSIDVPPNALISGMAPRARLSVYKVGVAQYSLFEPILL